MNIALYFGSFNPLHLGHKTIMETVLSLEEFDYLYLIVSPQNPLKSKENLESAHKRYKSALKTIAKYKSLKKVKVDDIELYLKAPNYTINTLRKLQEREPQNHFSLIIGADNLALIKQWKEYQQILLEFGVHVFPREGIDYQRIKEDLLKENPLYIITLIQAEKINISSTQIRNDKDNKLNNYLL